MEPVLLAPAPAEALDGSAPEFAAAPTTVEEIVDLVRWARQNHVALVPQGGGTERPVGNLLTASRWVSLRSEGRPGIVSFEREDTVVTVRPGARLSELQAALGEAHQFLPNDSPAPERATIGGIVACNRQGLFKALYGAPRDRVLGLTVVTGEGVVVRGGGRTVKNVAGYDLCKLFTGSRGSLGFIVEMTLRSEPIPPARLHLVYAAPSTCAAVRACLDIHAAHLQPAGMAATSYPAPLVAIELLGPEATVAWQQREIDARLRSAGLEPREDGPTHRELVDRLCPDTMASPMAGRAATPVGELLDAVTSLEQLGASLDVHVPNGIVYFAFSAAAQELRDAAQVALPRSANLRWTRLPVEMKRGFDVFGGVRSGFALMRGIKDALDPDGVFSPGRFAGRL